MQSITPAHPTPGTPAQYSTRAIFFLAGVGLSAWAPLVPYAKARLNLNEAQLGLLLLCLGVGSITNMPLAGALASRVGCRRIIQISTLCMAGALSFLTLAPKVPLMAFPLMLFGA